MWTAPFYTLLAFVWLTRLVTAEKRIVRVKTVTSSVIPFSSAVHRKLAFLVSFCVRKVDFFALTRSCVKIRFSVLHTKYTILSAIHRKSTLSVSFCVRKVDFPALVQQNSKCGKIKFPFAKRH